MPDTIPTWSTAQDMQWETERVRKQIQLENEQMRELFFQKEPRTDEKFKHSEATA